MFTSQIQIWPHALEWSCYLIVKGRQDWSLESGGGISWLGHVVTMFNSQIQILPHALEKEGMEDDGHQAMDGSTL